MIEEPMFIIMNNLRFSVPSYVALDKEDCLSRLFEFYCYFKEENSFSRPHFSMSVIEFRNDDLFGRTNKIITLQQFLEEKPIAIIPIIDAIPKRFIVEFDLLGIDVK